MDFRQSVEWLCKTAAYALVSFCYEDCVEALEKAVELVSSVWELHEVHSIFLYKQVGRISQFLNIAQNLYLVFSPPNR